MKHYKGKVRESAVRSKVIQVDALSRYPINDLVTLLAGEMMFVQAIMNLQQKFNSTAGQGELERHFIVRKLLTPSFTNRNRVAYLKRLFHGDMEAICMYLKAYQLFREVNK